MSQDELLQDWRARALALEAQVAHAVIGQAATLRMINVALFARGHVMLEGDVGVGKTTVLRAFARAVGGEFERVEGTVDMMPGDLIYHTYVDADGKPRIEPGPLLRHGEALATFFFNEINRARPQVQALLLRAMAERTVSAFNREFRFPHMTVFADRNRLEREETFELPSAARDRFMFELRMVAPTDAASARPWSSTPDSTIPTRCSNASSPAWCPGASWKMSPRRSSATSRRAMRCAATWRICGRRRRRRAASTCGSRASTWTA